MAYETLQVERDGLVLVVRLNRPHRMNAVIEQMYLELQAALGQAREDPEVRAVVLTGSVLRRPGGDKQAFCAGADLKEHGAGRRTPEQKRAYIELAHETTRQLFELPLPVVAAINGPARGAGAEMALNCDLVLMAHTASIAFPETGLGTMVGGGVTRHLTQLVGLARAKYLVYTGVELDGPAAAVIGLATASHPLDDLMPRALHLAHAMADKAPISMALAKDLLHRATLTDPATALHAETEAILACMETEDWQEGIDSFAERRPAQFRGR